MTSTETEVTNSVGNEENQDKNDSVDGTPNEYDPYYEPIISLPEIEVKSLEENELEVLVLRAKLFRFDTQETPPEWKERGTGTVKILKHKTDNTHRVVMRRDKTLKLCANHFITGSMELKPSSSCERAWVYSVSGDYVDEKSRSELLAIKFANVENAQKWKEVFEEAQKLASESESQSGEGEKEIPEIGSGDGKESNTEENDKKDTDEVNEKLSSLKVTDNKIEEEK